MRKGKASFLTAVPPGKRAAQTFGVNVLLISAKLCSAVERAAFAGALSTYRAPIFALAGKHRITQHHLTTCTAPYTDAQRNIDLDSWLARGMKPGAIAAGYLIELSHLSRTLRSNRSAWRGGQGPATPLYILRLSFAKTALTPVSSALAGGLQRGALRRRVNPMFGLALPRYQRCRREALSPRHLASIRPRANSYAMATATTPAASVCISMRNASARAAARRAAAGGTSPTSCPPHLLTCCKTLLTFLLATSSPSCTT